MREGHEWKLTSIPHWPKPLGYATDMKEGQLGWKCEKCQHWAPPQFTYSNPPADEVLVEVMMMTAAGVEMRYSLTCEEAVLVAVMES